MGSVSGRALALVTCLHAPSKVVEAIKGAHTIIPTPDEPPALGLACIRSWWHNCAEQWASPTPVTAVCEASGAPFPPAGGSWDRLLRQMDLCSNSIWSAEYVKVRWDPRHFASWASWAAAASLPETFGLCVFRRECSDAEVVRHLVPMFWWQRLVLRTYAMATNFLTWKDLAPWMKTDPRGYVGELRLERGHAVSRLVYLQAMRERALGRERRPNVSGAFCVVGMPRSFARPEIHRDMRANLIDALNFTERLQVLLLGLSGPRELAALQEAFESVPPDVLVTSLHEPEGHPPHRRCNASWASTEWHCNAQFRDMEHCMDLVRLREARRAAPYDWIVRVRPDTWFPAPVGEIHAYDPGKLHARKAEFSDVWDGFAIIPRALADVYFQTRFSAATEYCWVSSRGRAVASGECEHRLTRHLQRRKVPLEPIRMDLFYSSKTLAGMLRSNMQLERNMTGQLEELELHASP